MRVKYMFGCRVDLDDFGIHNMVSVVQNRKRTELLDKHIPFEA